MTIDLSRHATEVAPQLLGAVLSGPNGSGRIVEVEAYGGSDDPASHAHNGPTPRSAPMFGPSGVLYVYLIYGMHHCANVVTGPVGDGQAVLIRAIEPLDGTEQMRRARPNARREVDLTNGPGKLCEALEITTSHTGRSLLETSAAVRLETPPVVLGPLVNTERIGIIAGQSHPWRWYLQDNKWVSRLRAHE